MSSRMETDTGIIGVLNVLTNLQGMVGMVKNVMIAAGAGIAASKLESWQSKCWGQISTSVTETKVLGIIRGATGTSIGVEVTNQVACVGDSTIAVDVKKNGTSILSAVVTLNSSSSITVPIAGTVTTTALADGDIITAVITTTVGTGTLAEGVSVQWDYNEDHPNK